MKNTNTDNIYDGYIKYKDYMNGRIPSNVSDRVLKIWGIKECGTVIIAKNKGWISG